MVKVWKYSRVDALFVLLSILQLVVMYLLDAHWGGGSLIGRTGGFIVLVFMMTYNVIIISHLFTHTPWFCASWLNGLVSMLNSINIGQSVQVYQLSHVRNHHQFNNDSLGVDGKTQDLSSTYQNGRDGEHASVFHYAFLNAGLSIVNLVLELFSMVRLGRVSQRELVILKLVAQSKQRRAKELLQVRLDRLAHFLGLSFFVYISWEWTVCCYLPAFFLTLVLVNVQNYYEHYGAKPECKFANSASYYGRLYNWLTFNDGYHQEHHLQSGAHWSSLPAVRHTYCVELQQTNRIISPVPAILGFLDRNRVLLHKCAYKPLDLEPILKYKDEGEYCE